MENVHHRVSRYQPLPVSALLMEADHRSLHSLASTGKAHGLSEEDFGLGSALMALVILGVCTLCLSLPASSWVWPVETKLTY